jgi:hypothetical protein
MGAQGMSAQFRGAAATLFPLRVFASSREKTWFTQSREDTKKTFEAAFAAGAAA